MADIMQNVNPKRNPVTTILGALFMLVSLLMYGVKYIMPVFVVFKQDVPYEWWTPIIPLLIGVVLAFINDEYFARIFNRADKVVSKKTDTE